MTQDLTIRLLKDFAERVDPRADMPAVAHRFNLTSVRVKELVGRHGWPNPGAMGRAAAVLEGKTVPPGDDRELFVPTKTGTVTVPAAPEVGLSSATRSLRLADLVPHPSNPAGRTDDVAELAASIAEVGLLQPLVVTEHPNQRGWLILAGHRRHAALKHLGRTHVDCAVRPGAGGDLDEQLFVMLIENVHRQDLTAMEKAYSFGDLRDRRRMPLTQIATRAGLSPGTVSYYLSLLDLDASTQAKVQTGEIPVTVAMGAVKKVRRETRHTRGDKPVGRPVVLEVAWLGRRHVLARKVTELCTHTQRPTVGQVGCGQCWEQTIRADARTPDEAIG